MWYGSTGRKETFAEALHILVHLARRSGTHNLAPDCVQRDHENSAYADALSELKEAGLIEPSGGQNGGWRLRTDPAGLRVGDVCAALGEHIVSGLDFAPSGACQVEESVFVILDVLLRDPGAVVFETLKRISIADPATHIQRVASPTRP